MLLVVLDAILALHPESVLQQPELVTLEAGSWSQSASTGKSKN